LSRNLTPKRASTAGWLASFLVLAASSAPADDIVPLTEGVSFVSAVHGADHVARYRFVAQSGGSYIVELEQRGFDFVVAVEDSSGQVRTFNTPLFRDDREIVLIEDARAGAYLSTVRPDEYTSAGAGHAITVRPMTAAEDRRAIEAARLMSRAARIRDDPADARWEASLHQYRQAAALWSSLDRSTDSARALYCGAYVAYRHRYDWQTAAELAWRAAADYARANEPRLSANARALAAAALLERGNDADLGFLEPLRAANGDVFDVAQSILKAAYRELEPLGNTYDSARVSEKLGLSYQYRGDIVKARRYFQKALAIFETAGETSAAIAVRAAVGVLDFEDGQLVSAAAGMEQLRDMLPAAGMDDTRAWIDDTLAALYSHLGQLDAALREFQEAVQVHQRIDDEHGEADSLLGIGRTYLSLGDLELAASYLNDALRLGREVDNARVREAALRYLGNIEFLRGNYLKAFERHRAALAITDTTTDQVRLHLLLARDQNALGRYRDAFAETDRAWRISGPERPDITAADIDRERGRAMLGQGRAEQAKQILDRAHATYRSLLLAESRAECLHLLAKASLALESFDDAVAYARQALGLIETLRREVADPEHRAFHSAVRRAYSDSLIDIFMTIAGRLPDRKPAVMESAFEASERTRARMTRELLAEAAAKPHDPAGTESDGRRRELIARLAELRYQRDRLISRRGVVADTGDVDRIIGMMARTEHELNLLETATRQGGTSAGTGASPAPISLADVQAALEPGTTLLQYALGDKRSYAWTVSAERLAGIVLPPRAVIESAAVRAYSELTTYRPGSNAERPLHEALQVLSGLVVAPVIGLADTERIVVAADGALQYIPFAALPAPGTTGERLLNRFEIAYVPSVSVVQAMRARSKSDSRPDKLLVVGDPVFTLDDQRFGAPRPPAINPPTTASRGPGTEAVRLARLPYTGQEVETIQSIVPAGSRDVLTGFAANRSAIVSMDLQGYRFIHIATHGLIDPRYPLLSGLALSSFSADGQPLESKLGLASIFDLRLDADLLVLSACKTALGREIRGEGRVGLTQGFFYAGARSLVVSLWQVPDRGTAELVGRFYRNLIGTGMRPASALRQAKLSLASEARWRHPYFWSAMMLFGEWR